MKKPVIRRKWTEEEDCAMIRQFYDVIKMEGRVSGQKINLAKENEPCLRSRTLDQIRVRLSQIRLKRCSFGKQMSRIIHTLKSPDAKKYGLENLQKINISSKV